MPIQTATFAVQMKIRLGKSWLGGRRERCERENGEGGRERERETRRRRQGRVKGATEGRNQRWIMPNRGRAKGDKTGEGAISFV